MTTTFAELGVPPEISDHLAADGITEPFDIQLATIPDGLGGRDICGRAPTGSGKTLAFGIPMVSTVGKGRSRRPRGLILAPTRELAEQIFVELQPLARRLDRTVTSVYGGVGYGNQKRRLQQGVDVLIACPGRLADLISQGDCDLSEVDHVVIDEADRMADMGFLPEVKRLLDQTANDRQTVLFSATLDGQVSKLTKGYQTNPIRHEVGPEKPDITSMRHLFWAVERDERVAVTAAAISALGPTIVFTRTRHGADRLAKRLVKQGVEAVPIHGGRSQGQRKRALDAFVNWRAAALIATDVAARGIHVDEVAGVIHYDPPEDDATYIHRSGRTARAGASGTVISLVGQETRSDVLDIQRALDLDVAIVPADVSTLDGSEPTPTQFRAPGSAPREPGSRGDGRNGSKGGGSKRGGSKNGGSNRSGSKGGGSKNGGRGRRSGSSGESDRGSNGSSNGRGSKRDGENGSSTKPNRKRRQGRPASSGAKSGRGSGRSAGGGSGASDSQRSSKGKQGSTSSSSSRRSSQGSGRPSGAGGSRRPNKTGAQRSRGSGRGGSDSG